MLKSTGNDVHSLDSVSWLSILCSAGIFATTIQAQDFKDTAGDVLVGRQTLPLVHPALARPTLMIALAIWSIALSFVWNLNAETALLFNILGAAVGGRFIFKTSTKADQRSFYLYNVSGIAFLALVIAFIYLVVTFRYGCLSHTLFPRIIASSHHQIFIRLYIKNSQNCSSLCNCQSEEDLQLIVYNRND